MINIHEAIYALNPTVVTIRGDIAYDANENEVFYNFIPIYILMGCFTLAVVGFLVYYFVF